MDFGISLESASRSSAVMLLWKATAAFQVTKQAAVPPGSPSPGQKGGRLLFFQAGSSWIIHLDLRSILVCSVVSFSALRATHQSDPGGQQSSKEPMFLWSHSEMTCFKLVINLCWPATCLPLQMSWTPLPHSSANFWKKESVSILSGGRKTKSLSPLTQPAIENSMQMSTASILRKSFCEVRKLP